MATESGCPASGSRLTIVRFQVSTTASSPLGAAKVPVFTATSAQRPATATLVGSPPTSMTPSGSGACSRRMSTKPIRPVGASV
jgi:hypothetical protein